MVIYIDLFFLINFCCDALCIASAFRLGGFPLRLLSLVLSSSVGAAIACLCVAVFSTCWVWLALLSVPLIAFLASPILRLRELLVISLLLVLCGAIFSGLCYFVISLFVGKPFPLAFILFAAGVLLLLSCLLLRQNRANRSIAVTFTVFGVSYRYVGLIDSGNLLTDPMDGTAVAVLSGKYARWFHELLADSGRLYAIPVTTVSGYGRIWCFRADTVAVGASKKPARLAFALSEVDGAPSKLLLPASVV